MKEIIRTLKPYIPEEPAEAVKERLGVERLVRLSANENPYGTSPLVREAILSYVTHNDANYYPDGNASDLRMKLAGYWQVEPEQLVIGVGIEHHMLAGALQLAQQRTYRHGAGHPELVQTILRGHGQETRHEAVVGTWLLVRRIHDHTRDTQGSGEAGRTIGRVASQGSMRR